MNASILIAGITEPSGYTERQLSGQSGNMTLWVLLIATLTLVAILLWTWRTNRQ